MTEVEEDIQGTKDLYASIYKSFSKYDKVYYTTNESLDDILKNIKIKDKKVLSVQASGDQALYFLYNGAKQVDTFDINKLTFYYYILRIWLIRYLNKYYPPNMEVNFIRELLFVVKPQSENEQKAYEYWSKYLDYFNECLLLYTNVSRVGCSNLFQDLSYLKMKTFDTDFNFYNMDISKKVDIDNTYDVIFTSNIQEYMYTDNELETYRDNLYNMLNEKGMIISSNLIKPFNWGHENKVMREKFVYKPIISGFSKAGYCYIKK